MAATWYDPNAIAKLPELSEGESHPDVDEIRGYLRRFGYLGRTKTISKGIERNLSVGIERDYRENVLRPEDMEALRHFQRQFGLSETGQFDLRTRSAMSEPRCSMPDQSPIAAGAQGRWPRKELTFALGESMPSKIPAVAAADAVRSAFIVWQKFLTSFTFTEVEVSSAPDIVVEWRPAEDPDFSLLGINIAHADFPPFPPDAAILVEAPPLPLHFDDSEEWATSAKPGAYDIETVTLHEIGHCLGLPHSNNAASIMFARLSHNYAVREIIDDDLVSAGSIYA